MANQIISVKNLVKNYGNFEAVKGISFEVMEGEIFGLLGPNGAGKSTTLEIIETLRQKTKGEVIVDGFDLDKELMAMMSKSISQGNYDEPDADYAADIFQKALPELIDPKKEKAFNDGFNATGNIVKSDALPYTLFLSDVELQWDKTSKAFYNSKPFSIAFVDDKSIARTVPGYIELGFKRSGDYINLYIPAGDEDFWYYFYYAAGNMQIVAGEQAFNEALVNINPDKRRSESKDGKSYQYNPGSENKKNTFVNRMKFLAGEQ